MKREFTPETLAVVYNIDSLGRQRTPMHILPPADPEPIEVGEEFDPRNPEALEHLINLLKETDTTIVRERVPEPTEARPLSSEEAVDPELFNAIGSLATSGRYYGEPLHFPVLDVDAGTVVSPARQGRKAVLLPSHRGEFDIASDLPDMLEDKGIRLEVEEYQAIEQPGRMETWPRLSPKRVQAVILRAVQENTFYGVDSSTPGHNHLYIQKGFSEGDHRLLIDELTKMGILSENWQRIVSLAGMSIVRTPWARKPLDAYRS